MTERWRGRIVLVGGVGVDTIVRVPELPLPFVDTVHVPPIERHLGHSGSGWALGLAALGHDVTLTDLLGPDVEAQVAAEVLAAGRIELVGLDCPEGTKRSINLVAPDGRRTSLYDGRDQIASAAALDRARELVAGADHVHVTINDWTRDALRTARRLGRTVSTDLHDWNGENDYHREFARLADVVLVSAQALSDWRRTQRELLEHAGVVVVTRGAEGCSVQERGGDPVDVPAAPVDPARVVDTNGAGDAFGAAFLDGWLAAMPMAEAARRASYAAARVITHPGASSGHPDRATLDEEAGVG